MKDKNFTEKNSALKEALHGFIESYLERDRNMNFSEWLGGMLKQEMPEQSEEMCKKTADEIIEGIAEYNNTLSDLNAAIESGVSKDEWLAENLEEIYKDMPADEAGEKLSQLEETFTVYDVQTAQDDDNTQDEFETENAAKEAGIGWNNFSLKSKAFDIGKKAVMSGIVIIASMLKNVMEGGGASVSDTIKKALQNGIVNNSNEVKAVVAGAVKAAAAKDGENIPESTVFAKCICNIAGAAVDIVESIFDAASGKITVTEALDKSGRAVVAAGFGFARMFLNGMVARLPYFGPLLSELGGELLNNLESPQFYDNVCKTVHDTAQSVGKVIGRSAERIFGALKSLLKN